MACAGKFFYATAQPQRFPIGILMRSESNLNYLLATPTPQNTHFFGGALHLILPAANECSARKLIMLSS